jgi:predicted nuclease with TOPRIM domain
MQHARKGSHTVDEIANGQSSSGFDKMRTMLARAAELRADEQRQLYDMLDELRNRLSPLESFAAEGRGRLPALHDHVGAVHQRLGELPDRTEISVIAERLDEALARIDGQDSVLAQVITAMNNLSERMGAPLDALAARLDAVAGRFEGVSGRLDGLDDRLLHLHGRLDDIEGAVARLQGAVEGLPAQLDLPAVHRRFDEVWGGLHQRLDHDMGSVHGKIDEVHGRVQDLAGRPVVDPTERLQNLAGHLEQLAARIDALAGRIDAVEENIRAGVGTLSGAVEQSVGRLEGAVGARPDRGEVVRTLREAQADSERRITQQLDHALTAFAEVMLGRGLNTMAAPGPVMRAGGRMAGKKSMDEYGEG